MSAATGQNFRQAVLEYREPATGMVGLVPNPPDHSTDNGLLFTATYLVLNRESVTRDEINHFINLVRSCEAMPGCYFRYPGDPQLNRHDDLVGILAVSKLFALPFKEDIYQFAEAHDYTWNQLRPDDLTWSEWLGRMIYLGPLIRVATGRLLGKFSQLKIALAFLGNLSESKEETSGKCLLMLVSKAVYGNYEMVDKAIDIWRLRMRFLYSSPREMYGMYFKPVSGRLHPFAQYASESWE